MIQDHKLTAFVKTHAMLDDDPSSILSAAQLKAWWDSSPEELRVALNAVIDSLIATTAGASGAHQIGSETIDGVTGNTVYAQIASVKSQINLAVTGQIPEASITPAKLSFVPIKSTDYTAADVLTKLLTVDGSSSGLDSASVRGWYFRDTNGYPEYTTDGGGVWTAVGGSAVLVASNTVRESQATEYLLDTANDRKLVYKYVPKATGEIIITADIKGVQFASEPANPTDSVPSILTMTSPYDQTVNVQLSSPNYDYRTPLGTVFTSVNVSPDATVITSNDSNTYATLSKTLRVNAFQPVYFFLSAPNAPFAVGTKAGIKNIQIKYDMIRG